MRVPRLSRRPVSRHFWAILIILPHLVGCIAAPRPASEVVAEIPKPKQGAAPTGDVDLAVLPAGYWSKSGSVGPASSLKSGRSVVITGFEVELVDLQFQPGTPRQALFKPLPIPIGGVGLTMIPGVALEFIGVGRRRTPMSESEQKALTSALYDAFEADLRERGMVVVSRDRVIASTGPTEQPETPVKKSSSLMFLNPVGSDTGQVLHSRTTTEPGLTGGGDRWARRSEAEVRIMKETSADLALDIHLRVGTYRKKAALEHRSEIRLTTSAGQQTTLKALHSILSDADVIGNTHFVPVVGRVVPVNTDEFTRELKLILPKFLSLALACEGTEALPKP